MLLQTKNAIVYGAGGSIGRGVALEFAREGARVFLAGRTLETLEKVAAEVTEAGGVAEVAVLDAYDEPAVDRHVQAVAEQAGSVDVSLNLATRGDAQGSPLLDMTTEDLVRPVTNGLTTNFITARAAARVMVKQGSGVVLALNSGSAFGSPMMGGTGPADAAIDTFIRNLATEVGPRGVRVLGLWTAGVEDALTPAKLAAVNPNLKLDDAGFRCLLDTLAEMRTLRRSPQVAQIAATAAFLASDHAAAITGSFVNASSGTFTS
jgi:NAD(P)-dependent dehydrogenase (short-subunit alcohol dehydrogenase family)